MAREGFSSGAPTTRRLRGTMAAAALSVLALAVAPIVGTTAAAAAPHKVSTLDLSASATVKAKGATWLLSVGFDNGFGVGQQDLTVALVRTVKSPFAFEDHTWNFVVPASVGSFSTATGKGSLNVPTQAKPVATVSLKLSETSKKKVACSSGSEEAYELSVTGTATLDTGKGTEWAGTLTGQSWKGATNDILVDTGCVPETGTGCENSMLAASGSPTTSTPEMVAASGSLSGGTSDVGIVRSVKLSAPKGASRSDVVADYLSKVVVLTYEAGAKTMKVTTPASGLVHGSGSVVASKVFSFSQPCTVGTTKYKETTTGGSPAKWSGSVSAKPLLGGTMAAPKSTTTADFDVVKVTKI